MKRKRCEDNEFDDEPTTKRRKLDHDFATWLHEREQIAVAEIEALRAEKSKLEQQKEEVKEEKIEVEKQLRKADKEKVELGQSKKDAESAKSKLEEQMKEAEKEKDDVKKRMEEADKVKTKLKRLKEDVERRNAELEDQKQDAEEKQIEAEDKEKNAIAAKAAADKEHTLALAAAEQQKMQALAANNTEHQKSIHALNDKLNSEREENDAQRHENETLKSQLHVALAQINDMRQAEPQNCTHQDDLGAVDADQDMEDAPEAPDADNTSDMAFQAPPAFGPHLGQQSLTVTERDMYKYQIQALQNEVIDPKSQKETLSEDPVQISDTVMDESPATPSSSIETPEEVATVTHAAADVVCQPVQSITNASEVALLQNLIQKVGAEEMGSYLEMYTKVDIRDLIDLLEHFGAEKWTAWANVTREMLGGWSLSQDLTNGDTHGLTFDTGSTTAIKSHFHDIAQSQDNAYDDDTCFPTPPASTPSTSQHGSGGLSGDLVDDSEEETFATSPSKLMFSTTGIARARAPSKSTFGRGSTSKKTRKRHFKTPIEGGMSHSAYSRKLQNPSTRQTVAYGKKKVVPKPIVDLSERWVNKLSRRQRDRILQSQKIGFDKACRLFDIYEGQYVEISDGNPVPMEQIIFSDDLEKLVYIYWGDFVGLKARLHRVIIEGVSWLTMTSRPDYPPVTAPDVSNLKRWATIAVCSSMWEAQIDAANAYQAQLGDGIEQNIEDMAKIKETSEGVRLIRRAAKVEKHCDKKPKGWQGTSTLRWDQAWVKAVQWLANKPDFQSACHAAYAGFQLAEGYTLWPTAFVSNYINTVWLDDPSAQMGTPLEDGSSTMDIVEDFSMGMAMYSLDELVHDDAEHGSSTDSDEHGSGDEELGNNGSDMDYEHEDDEELEVVGGDEDDSSMDEDESSEDEDESSEDDKSNSDGDDSAADGDESDNDDEEAGKSMQEPTTNEDEESMSQDQSVEELTEPATSHDHSETSDVKPAIAHPELAQAFQDHLAANRDKPNTKKRPTLTHKHHLSIRPARN